MIKRIATVFVLCLILMTQISFAYPTYTETVFSNNEEAVLQEICVISLESSAMLVNGAVRYIDDDNLSATPRLVNEKTYLPLKSAEVLFKAYTDIKSDSAYVDFRAENSDKTDKRIVLSGNEAVSNENTEVNKYLIYIEGEPYIALRAIGEFLGKKVVWDDGYVIIGKEAYVNNYINNAITQSYAKSIIESFKPQTQGKMIYVAKNGKYTGTGEIDNPYNTIARATNFAQAGDTIVIREGTYRETIAPTNSGKPGKPITYKAYPGEKVVVSALEEVSGFSLAEDGLVSANVSSKASEITDGRHLIFYNGESIVEARFPNVNPNDYTASDVSPWFPTKGALKMDYNYESETATGSTTTEAERTASDGTKERVVTEKRTSENYDTVITTTYRKNWLNKDYIWDKTSKVTSYKVSSSLLNGHENGKWAGATFVTLHGGGWNLGTAKVKSSESGSLILDKDSVTTKWWFEGTTKLTTEEANKEVDPANFGYITGTREAIDLPGEWNVSDGKIYMMLPENETAESLKVEMKARQLCINLKNKDYINIDGIETIGGGANLNGSDMCVIKNCTLKNISHYTDTKDQREGAIDTDIPRFGNMTDSNAAPMRGEMGVYISGENVVFRNNTIDTSASSGLYLTGLYTYVDNNTILNTGYMTGPSGIEINTLAWTDPTDPRGGYIITNNIIRNSGRSSLVQIATEYGWANGGTQQAAFIPCEIAYNRFINGGIAACDTGPVYFWGATMGTESTPTRVHHNAIYHDCNLPSKFAGFVYHDNYANRIQTDNNVFFVTDKNIEYHYDVYTQLESLYPTSYAEADVFDNAQLGVVAGGIDSISESSYPGGLYFHTGVK